MTESNDEHNGVPCEAGTPRDRRNKSLILRGSIIWAALLIGATFVVARGIVPPGPAAWLVALLPTVVGVLVLAVYARYLRETDELQREIQLKALALGFGAGWIAMSGYPIFERLGAPAVNASIYVAIMAVFFTIGNMIGWRRYQ